MKQKLDEFKAHLPLIHAMLNPGMRERHWRKVCEAAGRSVQPNEMSTLLSLIEQQAADQPRAADLTLHPLHPLAPPCTPYTYMPSHP